MFKEYDVKSIFYERLKSLISENGLTKKEFSKQIEIPYTTVLDWLANKTTPSIIHIPKIAFFFKVSTDYLLGVEN